MPRDVNKPFHVLILVGWDLSKTGGTEGLIKALVAEFLRQHKGPLRIDIINRGIPIPNQQSGNDRVAIFHPLPLRPGRGLWHVYLRTIEFVLKTFSLLRLNKADVIHLHDFLPMDAKVAARMASFFFRIPLAATSHLSMSWDIRDLPVFMDTLTSWLFLKGSVHLLGVSRGAVKGLGKKAVMLGSGIDVDFFHPGKGNESAFRHQFNLPKNHPILFYPARFEHRKGQRLLVPMAKQLNKLRGRSDVQFVLMGRVRDADYFEKLRREVQKEGLTAQFHLLEPGTAQTIRNGYAACDIVVFPSLREGLGLIALESMAMEKPVVAHDIRGLQEVIEDGVTGYKVQGGDILSMAQKTTFLLDNPERCLQMGKAGRRFVESHYALTDLARKHLKFYAELLLAD